MPLMNDIVFYRFLGTMILRSMFLIHGPNVSLGSSLLGMYTVLAIFTLPSISWPLLFSLENRKWTIM